MFLGHVVETQGWLLRRCLSCINRICGRPYRPRDPKIRSLCSTAGVEWPDPTPRSAAIVPYEDEDDLEGAFEESSESDTEVDDDASVGEVSQSRLKR